MNDMVRLYDVICNDTGFIEAGYGAKESGKRKMNRGNGGKEYSQSLALPV